MQNTFNSVVNFFRVQENQSPDKPEESLSHQENVGDNPPETMNGSPTDKDNPAVNSKDTPSLTNTLPSNGNPTPTKGTLRLRNRDD